MACADLKPLTVPFGQSPRTECVQPPLKEAPRRTLETCDGIQVATGGVSFGNSAKTKTFAFSVTPEAYKPCTPSVNSEVHDGVGFYGHTGMDG